MLSLEQILTTSAFLAVLGGGFYAFRRREEKKGVRDELQQALWEWKAAAGQQHFETLKQLQDSIHGGLQSLNQSVHQTLQSSLQEVKNQMHQLNHTTDQRLMAIGHQVDQRLNEGLAKTNATFVDIIQRLATLHETQKQLSQLSDQVVDLQMIFSDKRSRGAMGEVQLNQLIANMLSPQQYALQHTLSNGCRVDCLLKLPRPTGCVAIDAKFPLETFRKLMESRTQEADYKRLQQQFKTDIKKHLNDIAQKYILPPETAEGAVMFLPAEAVFAEIHASYPELVEEAHRLRVWMASPSTMMAILTTAQSVLKDEATREHVHVLREQLQHLGRDFTRFQSRLDQLSRHIHQAQEDVNQVQTSARKITQAFKSLEQAKVEPTSLPEVALMEDR